MEPASITFVRHGETESNAADIWQGHGDSPLTERGRRQVAALGERLQQLDFDVVVASDLGRAVATAEAAGRPATLDKAWRELDMGEWDGMARSEIFTKHADLLAEIQSGKDIRWGGAESYGEFVSRIDDAVDALAASLGPGRRALVVTHGGVIHAVVAGLLGFRGLPRPWPVGRITNASLTTLEAGPRRLAAFNDAGHLRDDYEKKHSASSVTRFVRHGETAANLMGWWHGTTELDLTPAGKAQAAAAGAGLPPLDGLVASPQRRAQQTARVIGAAQRLAHDTDDRLREMDFGAWEGLTGAEITERFPQEWEAIEAGRDLPRGGTGDTWSEVTARMAEAARAIANGAGTTAAISHGGSIRALVVNALGLSYTDRELVVLPGNVSSTTLAWRDERLEVLEFNAVGHLTL